MKTFRVSLLIPNGISLPDSAGTPVSREEFFDWVWARFSEAGLVGVHEGTLFAEDAAKQGLETDSWLLDSAQAPQSRDWVGQNGESQSELYFSSMEELVQAVSVLKQIPELKLGEPEALAEQDWNTEWKKHFLNSGGSLEIPPFWKILPFQEDGTNLGDGVATAGAGGESESGASCIPLLITPGAGFGTGTHETTQLCLEAIGLWSQAQKTSAVSALDFGSGSGILSIGLAKVLRGGVVQAVEIDPLAIDNAVENAKRNGVEDRISFRTDLPPASEKYTLIVANILKPILIENAPELVSRLLPGGTLILSGLIEGDVDPVRKRFLESLDGGQVEVRQKGEWFCLVFRMGP